MIPRTLCPLIIIKYDDNIASIYICTLFNYFCVDLIFEPMCNSIFMMIIQRVIKIGAVMAGWIPVFDTMHGIRGEVNIVVKVDLFSDVNKFRQSSCGVKFFHCKYIYIGIV